MKFWTTDHISNDHKMFMLFEEDPNPRVGHNKDIFLADSLYHVYRGEDVFWVRVNDYNSGKQKKGDFSTLEDAKEFVYDVLGIEDDEDIVNSDFDLDFVKPHKHRGYYRPHELGLP